MNWKIKTWIQRPLAALPASIGDPVYHSLQHLTGLKPEPEANLTFLRRVEESLRQKNKPGLRGRRVIELGSGWHPTLPLLLLDRGVAEVATVDINKHYSRVRIREAAAAVLPHCESKSTRALLAEVKTSGQLPKTVRYYPNTAIQNLNPELLAGTDLCLSRNVLEHVVPKDMHEIHDASHRWIAPEGMWVHCVSSSDHRAYSDRSLHLVDFLRYDQKQWDSLAGNRYAYHNRLRLPQYRELFRRTAWRPLMEECEVEKATVETLKTVDLHPDFKNMDPRDLVAGSLWFVLEPDRAVSRKESR